MSSELSPRKKRAAGEGASRTPENDHRKRRRNRTTQSCLNCHTSKRMCDRKRPCGRCTQLGLTGLCIYEIDDPSQQDESQDEKSRLQKRVAELERIIRELKNKPHPRWVQKQMQAASKAQDDNYHLQALDLDPIHDHNRVEGSPMSLSGLSDSWPFVRESTSPSAQPNSLVRSRSSKPPPLVAPLIIQSAPTPPMSCISTFSTSPHLSTPSPLMLTPRDDLHHPGPSVVSGIPSGSSEAEINSVFPSSYAQLGTIDDGLFGEMLDRMLRVDNKDSHRLETHSDTYQHDEHAEAHCGCLNESPSYNAVLELTLRLRKAVDALGRSDKHNEDSACVLYRLIVELDAFVANTLGNAIPPTGGVPSSALTRQGRTALSNALAGTRLPRNAPRTPPASFSPAVALPSAPPLQESLPHTPWKDSFMSWESSR